MSAGIHGREVAQREAMEEAGVLGAARIVGLWNYKSRSYVDRTYECFIFMWPRDGLHQLRDADEPKGQQHARFFLFYI